MEQYRFDPYTGQPLNQRTGNNRTWLGNGYQTGGPAQYSHPPAQPQPSARAEQSGVIFRPVASFDEAKAVPTDFSGALTIMPDWSHGYIYAKALGDDGNPLFRAYRYEPPSVSVVDPAPVAVAYAPMEEVNSLRKELETLRKELTALRPPVKEQTEKTSGKGNKA